MSDPMPHNHNRVGYFLGYVFHPLTLFIPTLVVVMRGTSFEAAVGWVAFITIMILAPTIFFIYVFRRQDRHIYQREHRHILYITFWVSMLICSVLAILLDAPSRLIFSLVCLLIWTPMQLSINFYYTKISGHTAVISGIMTAFWVMGELDTPILISLTVGVVVATGWARIVTGNHTREQVILGVLVSSGAVLIAAVLMGWL